MPPSHPRRVGRYLLCDQIGAGGMASIHVGRMLGPYGFSRTVAIKRLHPQFAQNPVFVAMFTDEARLAVRIRHANVISPLDVVVAGSELFIVMDYVNGESLSTLLQTSREPLSPALASAIVGQALLGLHAAHEATAEDGTPLAIVHRDASPQNILVGRDGVARVLDFGIAKAAARSQITEKGKLKGKLGYFAPEQLSAAPVVDRRTDVFAMGIVLWECLTGGSLFAADSLPASAMLVLEADVTRPSAFNPRVTPELDGIVLRALARAPGDRYADAHSMAVALQKIVPPASPLDVGQWVERWMGDTLARNADLVRRIEALPRDESSGGSVEGGDEGAGGGRHPTMPLPAAIETPEEPSPASPALSFRSDGQTKVLPSRVEHDLSSPGAIGSRGGAAGKVPRARAASPRPASFARSTLAKGVLVTLVLTAVAATVSIGRYLAADDESATAEPQARKSGFDESSTREVAAPTRPKSVASPPLPAPSPPLVPAEPTPAAEAEKPTAAAEAEKPTPAAEAAVPERPAASPPEAAVARQRAATSPPAAWHGRSDQRRGSGGTKHGPSPAGVGAGPGASTGVRPIEKPAPPKQPPLQPVTAPSSGAGANDIDDPLLERWKRP